MIHATTFLALNQTSHLYVFRSRDSKCFESQIYQILCINFMHFVGIHFPTVCSTYFTIPFPATNKSFLAFRLLKQKDFRLPLVESSVNVGFYFIIRCPMWWSVIFVFKKLFSKTREKLKNNVFRFLLILLYFQLPETSNKKKK